MKKYSLICFYILIILVVLSKPVFSQRFDPYLDWREMDTGHFLVVFPASLKDVALEVAILAEGILSQIETFLNTTLSFRPAIVLTDNTDIPNGQADPLQGEIHLVISQPYNQFLGTKFRNWIHMVLAHELTHMLHLEAASPEIKRWRKLLGYVVLPNVIQPMWAWEGYAMYAENHFGTQGRLSDTLYDMYLREMALGNHFEPSHLLGGYSYLDRWPGQNGCYIYGASICQFIADYFGEKKLGEISTLCSDNFHIYGFDRALKKAIGVDTDELWKLWEENLKEKYQNQYQKIQYQKTTLISFITDRGYYVSGLSLSPDGEKLIYSLSHPQFISGLRLRDLKGSQDRLIVKGSIVGSPVFSHDGRYLVYSKMVPEKYYSWFDVFCYDLDTGKESRLTHGLRAFSPFFQNGKVFFLRRNVFPESLCSIDPTSGKIESVSEFPSSFRPIQATIDPTGKTMVISGWKNGFLDLAFLTEDEGLHFITSDGYADLSPSFSPDGKILFFSSDRNGVYNVYAYYLDTGEYYQVTNVVNGLFEPIYNGHKFYAIAYHRSGFDVSEFLSDIHSWKKIEVEPQGIPDMLDKTPPPPTQNFEDKPYQATKHLFPRYWVPLLWGGTTSARDYLGFHSYSLSYQSDLQENFTTTFSYQGLFVDPEIDFWFSLDQEKYQYSLSFGYPIFLPHQNQLNFCAGYEKIYRDDSLYSGCWEGFFLSHDGSFVGGNDSWITKQSINLTYQNGRYEVYPAQKTLFAWEMQSFRAGNIDHTWYAQMALGYSTLPQDFAIGGRDSLWGIAGYPKEFLRGKIAGRFELGYEFSLITLDQPLFSLGLVKSIHGKIYWIESAAGESWNTLDWIGSIGSELSLQSYLSEGFPLDLTMGYAHPLEPNRSGEWYLTLSTRFR
ncbi:hypothetical protein [Atribacter sp.]|jgi:hypothetical protein|uniref:hypothetical protein n=1 Tax=Atribacter sp. TaxID=2847780 RepID=UPI00345E1D04